MRTVKYCFYFLSALIVVILAVAYSFFYVTEALQASPSVIIFSIDTLRADHLGCYGYDRDTSPEIDSFSGEAVLFENAFSQSPFTAPSHMSLFTSLTPAVHRVNGLNAGDKVQVLNKRIRTIAQIFKERGYATIGLHGGGHMSGAHGFDRGFDVYRLNTHWGDTSNFDFIRSQIRGAGKKGKPVFLFIHHYICHSPYVNSPPEFSFKFIDREKDVFPFYPADLGRNTGTGNHDFWKGVDMSDPVHNRTVTAYYDGGIGFSDRLFGLMLKLFKEEGLYDDSVIVLLSDHGEEFYEHKGVEHGRLFREHLHVPLIIRFPGGAFKGTREPSYVRTFDLLPTLMQILNIKSGNLMQGVSFYPLLSERGKYAPLMFSYLEGENGKFDLRLMKNGYVYLYDKKSGGFSYLFDTVEDPFERADLSGSMAELANSFSTESGRIIAADIALRDKMGFDSVAVRNEDEDGIKQLRSLGYVQ